MLNHLRGVARLSIWGVRWLGLGPPAVRRVLSPPTHFIQATSWWSLSTNPLSRRPSHLDSLRFFSLRVTITRRISLTRARTTNRSSLLWVSFLHRGGYWYTIRRVICVCMSREVSNQSSRARLLFRGGEKVAAAGGGVRQSWSPTERLMMAGSRPWGRDGYGLRAHTRTHMDILLVDHTCTCTQRRGCQGEWGMSVRFSVTDERRSRRGRRERPRWVMTNWLMNVCRLQVGGTGIYLSSNK